MTSANCRVRGTFDGLSIDNATLFDVAAAQLDLGAVTFVGPVITATGLSLDSGTSTLQGASVSVAGDVTIAAAARLEGAAGTFAFAGDLFVDGDVALQAPATLSCGVPGDTVNLLPSLSGSQVQIGSTLVVVSGVTCTPTSNLVLDGLTVEAGATFNPGDTGVIVQGDIDIDPAATIAAQNLQAGGGVLRGTLPGGTSINGAVVIDGDVVIAGFATISSGGSVSLGGARPGRLTVQTGLQQRGGLTFGAGGVLVAESLLVDAGATLDLGGAGTMTLTGSFNPLAVSSSATIVRGAARGHRTIFSNQNATLVADAGSTVSLEDVELGDGVFLDVSNGGAGYTLVVDDLIVGAGSTVFTNTSTLTVEGACTGAGTCPP